MQVTELICFNCVHFNTFGGGCAAFGENIPEIIIQTNEHSEQLPDQENDIVFTPIENING